MLQNLTNMQSNTVKNTQRLTLTVGALIFFEFYIWSIFSSWLLLLSIYPSLLFHYYAAARERLW